MNSISQILRDAYRGQNVSLHQVLLIAGLSLSDTLSLLGVSKRTFNRWEASGSPDPLASRLLAILAGYVPWDGWQGWEVHGDCLFAPGQSRRGISPSALENLSILLQHRESLIQQNDALQEEIHQLRTELDQVAGKPKAQVLQLVK